VDAWIWDGAQRREPSLARPHKYPPEFRREACELTRQEGRSIRSVAAGLGIPLPMLHDDEDAVTAVAFWVRARGSFEVHGSPCAGS
jgi:hypothetical protein